MTIVNRTQCPKPNLTAYSIGSGVAVLSSDPTDPTVMPTSVRNTLGPLKQVSKVQKKWTDLGHAPVSLADHQSNLFVLETFFDLKKPWFFCLSALLLTVDETGGRYALFLSNVSRANGYSRA